MQILRPLPGHTESDTVGGRPVVSASLAFLVTSVGGQIGEPLDWKVFRYLTLTWWCLRCSR